MTTGVFDEDRWSANFGPPYLSALRHPMTGEDILKDRPWALWESGRLNNEMLVKAPQHAKLRRPRNSCANHAARRAFRLRSGEL